MGHKRRKYINAAPFQMKFVLAFVIVAFTGNILAITIFNYLALKKLDDLMWSTHLRVRTTSELMGPLFIQINIVAFIFICITLVIIGMMISRKITGSLNSMSNDITKAADGDLTVNISLRQKDEFKDVAYELDLAVQYLRKRFIALNERHGELSRSIKGLQEDIRDKKSGTDKLAAVIEKIDALANEIDKSRSSGNRE